MIYVQPDQYNAALRASLGRLLRDGAECAYGPFPELR